MCHARFLRQLMLAVMCSICFVTGEVSPALAQGSDRIFTTGDGDYDPAELRDLPAYPLTRAYIPEAVSLADRFPRPGDQKDIGACVAWSVGYAARSYYEIVATGASPEDASRIVSPASLHAQLIQKGNRCEAPATNVYRGLLALQARGARSLSQHPISLPENFCTGPDRPSGLFRIRGIDLVAKPSPRFGGAEKRSGISPDSLDRMRTALAAGHPVMIGMLVGKAFMRLQAGEVYSGSVHGRRDDYLPGSAGHAMVVTGYDNRRNAFQLMNSWGTDWGDGGFAWVDYNTMLSDARSGFTMRTDVDPPRPQAATSSPPPAASLEGLDPAVTACAELTVVGGAVTGFVATEAARQRVEQVVREKGLRNEVALRPWPICEVLKTLRAPRHSEHRPRIRLIGGDRPLHVGETFAIEVTPPPVPSYLYVVYIEDDGTVVNLLPKRGLVRPQVDIGSPPLVFGDGLEGRPRFRVTPLRSVDANGRLRAPGDPERGHEAIIAIAARAPIEELEDGSVYASAAAGRTSDAGPPDRVLLSRLSDITFRIADGATRPREVAADVLHVRIVD